MQRIPECTIQLADGSFCEAPSIEDAPFPICQSHALAVYQHMDDHEQERNDRLLANLRDEFAARRPIYSAAHEAMQRAYEAQSQVYYVRIHDHIKIGYSVNIKSRLQCLRVTPDCLLATEPGGQQLENVRHRQFADLRYGRWEDFEPADILLDHIQAVKARHGAPVLTSYLRLEDYVVDAPSASLA